MVRIFLFLILIVRFKAKISMIQNIFAESARENAMQRGHKD